MTKPSVREPYGPYGTTTCEFCHKPITRAHGPTNRRCKGSGQ